MGPSSFTVRLVVRQRTRYLSATSAEVPGLFLAGDSIEDLHRRAMPAVKHLLKVNRQLDVDVLPTDDLAHLQVDVRAC